MKVSTEIDNNFGYEKITQLVDNIPLTRVSISGNNFITYKKKKTNLVIFNAGKNFRSKIRRTCPHGVPPGMFSMVIVEISAESAKACSFHQIESIVFSTKKADHRYRKLINYALIWARPTLFIYLFLCQ
jgi:hypothetical protein